jgi:uncharacterized protein (DUF111 family)
VRLAGLSERDLDDRLELLGVEKLRGCVRVESSAINHIAGWRAFVDLPAEHAHRGFAEIRALIRASGLTTRAKEIAEDAFARLAVVEGEIHGKPPDQVTFHEVGALDSILDVCTVALLFDELSPDRFLCSPLPVCDGVIDSRHGLLAAPAPATLQLLRDVPVYGIDSTGETVTPTAIALLKALRAEFGRWPRMRVDQVVRVYGGRVVPNVPNGAIFVSGTSWRPEAVVRSHTDV